MPKQTRMTRLHDERMDNFNNQMQNIKDELTGLKFNLRRLERRNSGAQVSDWTTNGNAQWVAEKLEEINQFLDEVNQEN